MVVERAPPLVRSVPKKVSLTIRPIRQEVEDVVSPHAAVVGGDRCMDWSGARSPARPWRDHVPPSTFLVVNNGLEIERHSGRPCDRRSIGPMHAATVNAVSSARMRAGAGGEPSSA
jgi:hypothetical protein